jgi:shikimate dehydrogenase
MTLTGKARIAGVMGWPVGHSRSPALHGHWLKEHGIDGAYIPLSVRPEAIGQALAALPVLGLAGVNLTIPHKETALKHVARIDDQARRIGALNTIVVHVDGTLEGRNSDGFGFIEALRAGAPAWRPEKAPAVVLGAGGAARSVLVTLLDAGVPEIRLTNRTAERAQALAKDFGKAIKVWDWTKREDALAGVNLLVNTTSLGMAGQAALDMKLTSLPGDAVVNDIVYAPLETKLLAAARARGNPAVDGLGMLLHQGRVGFRAWFGVDPKVTPALHAAIAATIPK